MSQEKPKPTFEEIQLIINKLLIAQYERDLVSHHSIDADEKSLEKVLAVKEVLMEAIKAYECDHE